MSVFEISPEDIAHLDDKQLRALVARLCEAELRNRGYSTAAVTWGGDQNAKDGGLDVRVSLPDDKPIDGFIPRRSTGFQVKKQNMPPSEIAGEMCPGGELRPTIRELAESGGAYIIASSQGSTADAALTKRKQAMVAAVGDLADRLTLDFYDRTRLSTWVRNHAGLVAWVRREVGRAIPGWEPFDAWAYPAGGADAEYLLENGVRVRDRSNPHKEELSAADGQNELRAILRQPGKIVRLIGLSGVGKTRFVQALFDGRIGKDALDPALAVYTNLNNEPDPTPFSLASDLSASGTRTILIVDNCASELHSRLTQLVVGSTCLSALTIEYDIQDDLPERTDVFELRAASVELIESLLKIRFPLLSQVDARTAAEFSGGNARIAIALADTVGRGLAQLNDKQLFERLFAQRQGQDRPLLEMAQACALVYSFNGEDVSDGDQAELFRIAALVGATADQAHSAVAELLRRELAQRRGQWRAVLPHAIANRLAATALQDIPLSRIEESLTRGAPQRLTKSFARRLGFLDTSKEASEIAYRWLGPDGWIGKEVWNLNEFGKAMFQNILPAAPDAGLEALEANLPTHDTDTPITTGSYVPGLLRSLAWDRTLFERCTKLLQVLAIYGDGSTAKDARQIHESLFHLFLSGTHATGAQRINSIRSLVGSDSAEERSIGIAALDAMLKTHYFSSLNSFQFGAHSRDYGYHPKTVAEALDWYRQALSLAAELALSESADADAARETISAHFRGLWTLMGLHEELGEIVAKIVVQGFWREGWRVVKQTRFYDEKNKESDNYARLTALEELLRPHDLIEQVRAKVFSSEMYDIDSIDTDDPHRFRAAIEQQETETRTLGRDVAQKAATLKELLPEIVTGKGHHWNFGMGLAQGTTDPSQLWTQLVGQLGETPSDKRNIQTLCGFLWELAANKSPLPEELLDDALGNETLARYFPAFQAAVPLSPRGMTRLSRSLKLGKIPVYAYASVRLGRAVEGVPAADIAHYIVSLAKIEDGEPVAVELLGSLFFSDRRDKRAHAAEILDAGRTLLQQLNFDHFDDREDHQLQIVLDTCASGDAGYPVGRGFCERLKQAIAERKAYGFHYHEAITAIAKVQPRALLDALLTGEPKAVTAGVDLIEEAAHLRGNPMDEISEDTLLTWCADDPMNRFPAAAAVISAFALIGDRVPARWNPIASRLVHAAPDSVAVMGVFVKRLRLSPWSGARSGVLNSNADLLDHFDTRGNGVLASFIAVQKGNLRTEALEELTWEAKRDRNRDETFE